MPSKKFFFFSCVCIKWFKSAKKGIKNAKLKLLTKEDTLEVESYVANWAKIFDKCDPKNQKYEHELMLNKKCQQCRVFVRNDLVGKKIKTCRKSSKRFLKFKKKLGLNPHVVTFDEQDIISALQVAFEREKILSIVLKIK